MFSFPSTLCYMIPHDLMVNNKQLLFTKQTVFVDRTLILFETSRSTSIDVNI